jgi:thioredoxin 1
MAVTDLTTEQFNDTIENNAMVVIDFWAEWCGPCKSFAPVFSAVSEEHPEMKFVKVDTDAEQALAGHFGIRSIPTLMIFRDQVIVFQQAGALPKGSLNSVLEQVKALDMEEVKRGAQPYQGG